MDFDERVSNESKYQFSVLWSNTDIALDTIVITTERINITDGDLQYRPQRICSDSSKAEHPPLHTV